MLDDLILQIDDYLRQFNHKFVYCGSISLYLNGCKEITKFSDIDVDYIDLTDKEKEWVKTTFSDDLPGDNVTKINDIETRYHEITFHNRKMLISDLDYELEIRYELLKKPNYSKKEKVIDRINLIKRYLNIIID